jgi:hypothetical protein
MSTKDLLDIDEEIAFIEASLEAIEPLFNRTNNLIQDRIKNGEDITSINITYQSEFLSGLAFTICQKYLKTTLGWIKIDLNTALKLGKQFNSELSYVRIINEAANYWKHMDEWNVVSFTPAENNLYNINIRDSNKLKRQAQNTLNVLQEVTQWSDYTCFNVLFQLTLNRDYSLLNLIPILKEWRTAALEHYRQNT